MSNSIRVIHPYWHDGSLVFDDETAGLVREPFVAGADVVLGILASGIEGCSNGFTLRFSDRPFPGYQTEFVWDRPEHDGNWYTCEIGGATHEGWLCPALLQYFDSAPERIYIEIAPSKKTLGEMWRFIRKASDNYS